MQRQRQGNRAAQLDLELPIGQCTLQRRHAQGNPPTEIQPHVPGTNQNTLDAERRSEHPQRGGIQQQLGFGRERTVPVAHFAAERVDLLGGSELRKPPVEVQLLRFIRDVRVGDQRCPIHRNLCRRMLALLPIPFQLPNHPLEHPHVGVEADRVHEAGLSGAQDVTRTPQLEVLQRDPVAAPQLRVVLEHPQPLFGLVRHIFGDDEIAVRPVVRTPDAATNLVQLGQTEVVGAVDDQGVRARDIQTRFDDRSRNQHVHFPRHECAHHLLELSFPHLPVRDGPRGASGRMSRTRFATVAIVSTRLWTKKTWPPRSSSRRSASSRIASDQGIRWVMIG